MKEKEIVDLVLQTSSEFEDFLNNDLLKRFGELHNIDSSYNKFFLKQEIITKGAYFLAVKKKYALHIINQEGVPVDEIEVKGLVTRRSDYPSYPKEKIHDLLNLLLSEDFDRKKIRELIDNETNTIREMCQNGLKEVARPVSYSKDKKDYKKQPIQIDGMELWNELEYHYFVRGVRGYLFKIVGVDFNLAPKHILDKKDYIEANKLQYIVLPDKEERLPNYYIIDIDAMMKFAWYSRVNELLDAEKSIIYDNPIITDNERILLWDE